MVFKKCINYFLFYWSAIMLLQNGQKLILSIDRVNYIDLSTIQANGHLVKSIELNDFKKEHKLLDISYLSSKEKFEYDCNEGKKRILSFTLLSGNMGNGDILYSVTYTDKWSPVKSGSIGESTFKIACKKI